MGYIVFIHRVVCENGIYRHSVSHHVGDSDPLHLLSLTHSLTSFSQPTPPRPTMPPSNKRKATAAATDDHTKSSKKSKAKAPVSDEDVGDSPHESDEEEEQ